MHFFKLFTIASLATSSFAIPIPTFNGIIEPVLVKRGAEPLQALESRSFVDEKRSPEPEAFVNAGMRGYKRSSEAEAFVNAGMRGYKRSSEAEAFVNAGMRGYKRSSEAEAFVNGGMRGHKRSPEAEAFVNGGMRGHKRSPKAEILQIGVSKLKRFAEAFVASGARLLQKH